MRKLLVAVLVTALAGVLTASAFAATRSVKVGDNYFVRKGSKPTITVKKGTKVTWRWAGKQPHNVHVTSGPAKFKSSVKVKGTFSKTVKKKGTYKLRCDIHPDVMKMTLRVK